MHVHAYCRAMHVHARSYAQSCHMRAHPFGRTKNVPIVKEGLMNENDCSQREQDCLAGTSKRYLSVK